MTAIMNIWLSLFIGIHAPLLVRPSWHAASAPSDFPTEVSVETLRSLLSLPRRGSFEAEKSIHSYALPTEIYDRSFEYIRRLRPECRVPETQADVDWLKMQAPTLHMPPIALDRNRTRDEHTSSIAQVKFDGSDFAIRDTGTNVQGTRFELLRFRNGESAIVGSSSDGSRAVTIRAPLEDPSSATSGWMLSFVRWARQAQVLLDMADEQGALTATADAITFDVSLRPVSARARFDDWCFPSNGVLEIPGMAHGEFRRTTDHGFKLSVEWRDCGGGLVWKTQIVWIGPDHAPRSLVESEWAPGTDFRTREFMASILPAELESLPLRWQPAPGEQITDRRFGARVRYTADDSGRIPSDDEIAAESGHLSRKSGQEPTPIVMSSDATIDVLTNAAGLEPRTSPTHPPTSAHLIWGLAIAASTGLAAIALWRRR